MVYIKGAIADPCVKTINPPNITKTINIGNNQNFFLTFKNFQNSKYKCSLIPKKIFLISEKILKNHTHC